MELTRRQVAALLAGALAATACGLWRWTSTAPRRVLRAATNTRFPGRLRPWTPITPPGLAPWKG
ncbi:MAG: hypothetical protein K8T26_04470 [Lentisphaerae bacterium]|nr:hypothetical protein [Lentisphaerota bacterium]